jgi:hypothetical protein
LFILISPKREKWYKPASHYVEVLRFLVNNSIRRVKAPRVGFEPTSSEGAQV